MAVTVSFHVSRPPQKAYPGIAYVDADGFLTLVVDDNERDDHVRRVVFGSSGPFLCGPAIQYGDEVPDFERAVNLNIQVTDV